MTPFIANYGRQDPWVWALEALPVYDAFARLKSQAHWQTDVIAGWALGTGVGYWSYHPRRPFVGAAVADEACRSDSPSASRCG